MAPSKKVKIGIFPSFYVRTIISEILHFYYTIRIKNNTQGKKNVLTPVIYGMLWQHFKVLMMLNFKFCFFNKPSKRNE